MFQRTALALGLSVFSLVVCLTGPSHAAAGEKEDAVKLVGAAADFLAKNGKEKAVVEIKNKGGQFVKGEIYVFAYDLNGVMVAHPQKPDLIGKNLLDTPDAEGKFFRKDIIDLAKSKGEGWVDYKYKNPSSGKLEDKTTFLKKAGDLVLCAGVYKN